MAIVRCVSRASRLASFLTVASGVFGYDHCLNSGSQAVGVTRTKTMATERHTGAGNARSMDEPVLLAGTSPANTFPEGALDRAPLPIRTAVVCG